MKKILSNLDSNSFLDKKLDESEIINLLSDLKHRVFPRSFERLSPLRDRRELVGVEIGVCGGEHALSLLKTLDHKKIYLIDPYEMYEDYSEGQAHYGVDQANLTVAETSAKKILRDYQNLVVWVKDFSKNAIKKIEEPLDYVYIDGNHAYEYVVDDIRNYFPLIKSGGVIGGHDFYNGFQSEHDGVISAVCEFAIKTNSLLKVDIPDWWIQKK